MAEEKLFTPHLFAPGPVPEGALPYPTQSKKKPTEANLAGELRGYYGPPQFNPHASQFGKVRRKRDGGPKNHGGVDIYAPYVPFPHETPVHAICDGRLSFHFHNEAPDDIGNRAWLVPKHAENDRLVFGHLNRFVGRDRPVKKGELIGFAGCSGNADGAGECTTIDPPPPLHINSGHVHLAYWPRRGGNTVDPLLKLGWALRFADVKNAIPLKDWKDGGHLLDVPVPPDFAPGLLRTDKPSGTEAVGKHEKPSRLKAPFETIDFDDQAAIGRTAAFYRLAHARLGEDEPDHPKAKFHQDGVSAFRESIGTAEILLRRQSAIIAELDEIARAPEAPETLPTRIRLAQTRTVEFLFDGLRLLSLAMAGEALLHVARHPEAASGNKIKSRQVPVPGGPWTGIVPRSGIGLSGKSILVALGNGRAALHASFLKTLADDAAAPGKKKAVPYSRWTLSVSFGAGTPWHAILDQKFADEAGKLPRETGQALRPYANAVYECTYVVSALARVVCDNSKVVDPAGLQRYLASVRTMMGAVAGEAEESGEGWKLLDVLKAIGGSTDTIRALLSTLAGTSADAAAQAAACFDPKIEQLPRIRSAYDLIRIEPSG